MSVKKDVISVIIPVYKVEKYLERCIKSVVEQTYKNLEIIIVDDGSPDRCPDICDAWAKEDSRIKVIHKDNGGLSSARNAGLRSATGQYIGFVDSDDWIAEEMYERLLTAIENDKSDIAACSVKMIWEDGSRSKMLVQFPNEVLDKHSAQKCLLEESKLKNPVVYKLYKREVLKGILFDVGKYHEDAFWSYRAIGAASKVSIIEYIGYFYLQRQDSIMGEQFSIRSLDAVEAYGRRYEYMKENFPSLAPLALVKIWDICNYDGQRAMRYMQKADKKKAFQYLRRIQKKYPIKYIDYADQKATHKLWIMLSKISLRGTCALKNALKINL